MFNFGDFSTCDAPGPGRPKTMTTPEIIDQIHELILKDRQISDFVPLASGSKPQNKALYLFFVPQDANSHFTPQTKQ